MTRGAPPLPPHLRVWGTGPGPGPGPGVRAAGQAAGPADSRPVQECAGTRRAVTGTPAPRGKRRLTGLWPTKPGETPVSETRSLHLGPAQMLLLARSEAGSFGRPYVPWPSVTLRRMCRARKRMTVHPHHPSLIHEAGKARKEKYPESH